MDKKTILVVDDAEINRMTLTAMFEDEYDILEATDGAQALKVLKSNAGRIAMILLDIIMPNMDGIEFLKRFHKVREYESIPVMLITSSTDTALMHKALDYGILDTIQKPFDADITQKRVRNLINLYKSRAQEEQMESERRIAEAKARFLANMSHEIRTPMNAVRGMAEIGLNETDPEEKDQCFSQICSASDNLLSIINDILDFSKLSSGGYELSEENYTVTSLVNDVVNIMSMRAMDKNIELIVDLDPAAPTTLFGDPDRIRQIILNLANNAVKFTSKGYVRLKIWLDGTDGKNTFLNVEIKDTGIGIKPEDQKTIFNAFVQVDNRYIKAEAGTGLGLAISQELTALMRGTLTMESVYGKGSTFTLRLPQKLVDAAPGAHVDDPGVKVAGLFENQYVREAFKNLMQQLGLAYVQLDDENAADTVRSFEPSHVFTDRGELSDSFKKALDSVKGTTLITASKNGEHFRGGNRRIVPKPLYFLPVVAALNNADMRNYLTPQKAQRLDYSAPQAAVLLVDDNIVNLRVAEGHMRPYKIRPVSVTSGEEAIAAVQRQDFDLVLMDHMMPVMDGIEAAARIRALGERYQKLPIIALTATAIKGARDIFLSNGFNDFISKPMTGHDLAAMLHKWLPPEKILEGGPISTAVETAQDREAMEKLERCRGIDLNSALEITGGIANLCAVIRDFGAEIQEKSDLIQRLADVGDMENYTIEVHSLKTLARTIGARELGEQAAYLEACGRGREAGEVAAKTPALVEKYRGYIERLLPVTGVNAGASDEKKPVERAQFVSELETVRAALKEYDIDAADKWAEGAAGYGLPTGEKSCLDSVLKDIRAVDYIGAIKNIDILMSMMK